MKIRALILAASLAESPALAQTTQRVGPLQVQNGLAEIQAGGSAAQAAARTNLGLGGAATLGVGTAAGTVAAGNDARIVGAAQAANNLSDLGSASSARVNLGLGGAAVLNVGTATGTVADGGALTSETSRAQAAEALRAPLASPALTGAPTAPTPTAGTNTTQIATGAYVGTAVGTETTRAQAAEAAAQTTANAALPATGGTMTGQLHNSVGGAGPGIFGNTIQAGNTMTSYQYLTTNNLTGSGATLPQHISETSSLLGFYTGGNTSVNSIALTDELANVDIVDGFETSIGIGQYAGGGINGLHGNINVGSTPAIPGPYVGSFGSVQGAAPLGPSGSGGIANYVAGIWGGWDLATLTSTATGYYGVLGRETDTNISASAHPAVAIISDLVDQGTGTGSFVNTGLMINGNPDLTDGVEIGGPVEDWPLQANSTIILAQRRSYSRGGGTGVDPQALYGIDFRTVAFGAGGSSLAVPDFGVDSTGNATASSLTTSGVVQAKTAVMSGVTVNSGGLYINWPAFSVQPPASGTTATATAATMGGASVVAFGNTGTGYAVGQTLTASGGTGTDPTYTVTSVDASGGITGLSVATPGALSVPPSPTSPVVLTGGTGAGAEVTITWAISISSLAYVPSTTVFAATGAGFAVGNTIMPVGDTGTEPVFTVASITATGGILTESLVSGGAVTALATGPYQTVTTNGSGTDASVQVGWSIASMSVTGGSGYLPAPPPLIYESLATSDSEKIAAQLTAVMTASAAPLSLNPSGGAVLSGGNPVLTAVPPVANDTVLGNVSGSSATPVGLSQVQLTALVNPFSATLPGDVPASAGGTTNFLRADGTWANPITLGVSYFLTAGQTVSLPTGWHSISFKAIGGAGGSGCGAVTASGTAASGGGTGGSATRVDGEFLSSITGGTSLTVTIGAVGTSCVASGTTAGSTGTTPTAGGNTVLTVGTGSRTAWGAGAGSNGAEGANSAGGGSAGLCLQGGSASGATAGSAGGCGGSAGGSGVAGTAGTLPWAGTGGNGAAAGSIGTGVSGNGAGVGASGSGLAATPAALAGVNGARPAPTTNAQATAGAATCTGTSQNGGSGAAVGGSGTDLTGGGGGSGASCTTAAGGSGGAASGYGASGGGGGSSLAGFIAGSGGTSTAGAALVEVF